eukprot:COSAG06_NODE_968_length_11280_cov_125.578302_4_plen_124_part_00
MRADQKRGAVSTGKTDGWGGVLRRRGKRGRRDRLPAATAGSGQRRTLGAAAGPRPCALKTATWVAGSPGNGHLGPQVCVNRSHLEHIAPTQESLFTTRKLFFSLGHLTQVDTRNIDQHTQGLP